MSQTAQDVDGHVARRGRGFWLVAAPLLAASALLVVAIWANRDLKETIGHAQDSLRRAETAAERIVAGGGSLARADASGLASSVPSLVLLGPDQPSADLDEVSVFASETAWAAAVQARPGACFFLRLDPSGQVFFGTGTVCTGRSALGASEPRW